MTQARAAFERRIEGLRKQLIDAGLTAEKVNEIIGEQTFSLENVTQTSIPLDK
ncbi:virulence-associated protein D [Rhodoferax antarcticus ANT.BR]|uniref:Virulence-associated protein D n=1 Tax=Rhodoferax antarcticus ANT.BR TaxID=1111071 RepID=A0A1Q8YD08_9BURK|nr:virulence-associated protein D [Rhodoferax antarcticus ANT.BR]